MQTCPADLRRVDRLLHVSGSLLSSGVDQLGGNVGANAKCCYVCLNVVGVASLAVALSPDLDFAVASDGKVAGEGEVSLLLPVNVAGDSPASKDLILSAGVLESNVFAIGSALHDGDGALGAALVGGLGAHFTLYDLANLQ